MHPYRSVLFVPAHKPEWVTKAIASGADAVVLDLEDSVPADRKAEARGLVADTVGRAREAGHEVGLFVRPNALDTGLAGTDLEAAVCPGLTGLFVPKVRDRDDVLRWETLVDWFELRNILELRDGLEPSNGAAAGSALELIVPVEMVEAIQNCREIAGASPRVGAMIGPTAEHADIARAVGYRWSREGTETLYLRSRILLACREYGLHALTGLWEDLSDLDGLKAFADYGLQLGFRGQIAIHPSHVSTINEVFSPTPEEIEFREGLVAAFEEASARGDGAVRYRGIHIDKAHADTAREWLAHARRVTGRA
ncbi:MULTISPECIES: HpcH/HpaI aldolase/citrate lyase family protein [Prauserella salsuginis group]|uniref:HpcH/HpaI aldolase/citrate lyase family protein n=1 Tax=Prauserella salsuginis TaxID=387889 RepID=A0ABW6G3H1_9PSEU|nr:MULTISPECIES: CoA ester lyase [Prauserella salsuginis group]MCR3718639.1 citrate lyase subunit beta / citryl-CoA lyase [Prauserella flava]MCR3733209.1 citrate lyase subunit beta / citryl-CoA lyase [Prauserella salsuginis]